MLTITNSAWDRLTHILASRPALSALRITCVKGRVKCRKGAQRKDDQVIDEPQRPTLFLTPKVAAKLGGRTLDVRETSHGTRLRLRRAPR